VSELCCTIIYQNSNSETPKKVGWETAPSIEWSIAVRRLFFLFNIKNHCFYPQFWWEQHFQAQRKDNKNQRKDKK
jgi:hypothetical protein